ncbi:MAG: radical SAM family heme chaperone HemW [Succinivibrio sp.]
MSLNPVGLYIHYPWCIRKCPYCDFNSYRKDKDCCDKTYADTLIKDFKDSLTYLEGRKFISVYLGGGTPSLFPPAFLERLFKEIRPYVGDNAEISMEANPGTVTYELLKEYRDLGVNRLSLGIQSFNDNSLRALGRIHNGAEALRAVDAVHKAGFDNFNLDIMHGLPGQSLGMALDDLKKAVDSGATHLSWYELTLEEDTAFGANPPDLPDEDELSSIEMSGFDYLESNGFKRYEISGFSKGKPCVHNLNYWYFGDYIGIGAGAHSKVFTDSKTRRRAHAQDVSDYINEVMVGDCSFDTVSEADIPFEFMLNRLRVFNEIGFDEFEKTTALPFSLVKDKILKAETKGLIKTGNDSYQLTSLGKWMVNDILEDFL